MYHFSFCLSTLAVGASCDAVVTFTPSSTVAKAGTGTVASITFANIYTRYDHTFAQDSNGQLYAWGWNSTGKLSGGDTIDRAKPTLVNLP